MSEGHAPDRPFMFYDVALCSPGGAVCESTRKCDQESALYTGAPRASLLTALAILVVTGVN